METVNVVEAKKNFSDLMARVAYSGQHLLIERHHKPMMVWLSIDEYHRLQQANDDVAQRKARRMAALEQATTLRQQILQEYHGVSFSNSTDLINQMREEQMNRYDDLR